MSQTLTCARISNCILDTVSKSVKKEILAPQEFLKGHTVQAVEIIGKFLGMKNFDAFEVAEKSSFKKASKREVKKVRETDFHQKLYRSGTTQGLIYK